MTSEDHYVAKRPQSDPGPWLAIITVAKDDEDGVLATLKSISEQVLDGIEWILVDGSSSPFEHSLPEDLQAILSYIWEPPRGIYHAMNLGLSKAKAPHVLFLNAGDVLANRDVLHSLQPCCQTAQSRWLYGRTELVEPDGRRRLAPGFDFVKEKRHRFRRGRFPQQPATLYSTSDLRALGGFDERLSIAADYRAMLQFANRQSPQFVDATISRFKLDGTSSMNWQASLSQALEARCEVYGLGRSKRAWEWILSREIWIRSWLYRKIRSQVRPRN